jgi:hypothetical protein
VDEIEEDITKTLMHQTLCRLRLKNCDARVQMHMSVSRVERHPTFVI